MALRWLVHSACHVLGYPNKDTSHVVVGYHHPRKEDAHGDLAAIIKVETTYPSDGFRMPLHYPRYTKADYQRMEEWRVDMLLRQYGLCFKGTLEEKRAYAISTFLWPGQY